MDGWKVVGDAANLAEQYAEGGADELIYVDVVASLYGRCSLVSVVTATTERVFIPITVGGGIRTIDDVTSMISMAGADKVAINTAALRRPEFISEVAERYGSQAVVVSIEAKRADRGWECFTDSGREPSGRGVVEWAVEAIDRGAGEILVTSIDRDGTKRGLDLQLIAALAPHIRVPLTVGGGAGNGTDVADGLRAGADAVAIGAALHTGCETIEGIKRELSNNRIDIRPAREAVS